MYEAVYDYKDIANYIVAYSNQAEKSITNLRLQKIMYYIQGYFLRQYDALAFSSDIVNWPYGPVVLDAYYDFCVYGHTNIDQLKDPDAAIGKISDRAHRTLINNVIDACLSKSITALVEDTHNEDPWKTTHSRSVITCDKISDYFTSNNPLNINL